nr:ABC transporter ATP-binding protein [Micromonospora rosaria]
MASAIDSGARLAWDGRMPFPSSQPVPPPAPGATGGTASSPIVHTVELTRTFGRQTSAVTALDRVSIAFEPGRFTSIMGPSGSGKSTLLHCLAGLERPSLGSVVVAGTDLARLSEARLTTLRRDRLGFVFQAFNLIPTLTAEENITLSERIGGPRIDPEWTSHLVQVLGLGNRLRHRPHELSGGQQQRVAIARALAHRPAVVFADEPTGNLDSHTGSEVLHFLRLAVEQFGQTIVMVTHDPAAAARSHRVVFLRDGRVEGELRNPSAGDILGRLATNGSPA